ncbi:Lipopolysaccharide export system ATP-binding protein LptB [Anaerococcus prevotii]|uniref:ABC transporter related n=1 Tax=Anaerococcus prevotii (strain ATCC 9321 / DSM 20548 / JCM 6508 / NCTC 11806 / PC1) TaxID=525919 RepID=C7RE88_ANAPD|nr:ABC transporter ATP-binding protein [Anaerococcus prevotii]ACV29501.1 ABC transporter related [Anaerococcus prevotii DSM 20548]SUU95175.1 Lipopolysaccharide export system ATP-binding protein LptB [Anaerococcus prevotii]
MDKIITIDNLTKKYKETLAIDDLSLEIEKGKVVGLLGPNGSGKSTLLKLIVGLLKKDSGKILIDGKSPGIETKSMISYLPDSYYLYEKLTVRETIDMYGDFYKDFDKNQSDKLLDYLSIPRDKMTKDLSKGLRERLLISLNLSRDADIFIMDEPVDGVDPVAKQAVIDMIIEKMAKDKTFIITTHQIGDLENLFEDIIFLDKGKVLMHKDAIAIREENMMEISDYYKEVYGLL